MPQVDNLARVADVVDVASILENAEREIAAGRFDPRRKEVLMHAVDARRAPLIEQLLRLGVDSNAVDAKGDPPFGMSELVRLCGLQQNITNIKYIEV